MSSDQRIDRNDSHDDREYGGQDQDHEVDHRVLVVFLLPSRPPHDTSEPKDSRASDVLKQSDQLFGVLDGFEVRLNGFGGIGLGVPPSRWDVTPIIDGGNRKNAATASAMPIRKQHRRVSPRH